MDKIKIMQELLDRYQQLDIFDRGYSPAARLIIVNYIRNLELKLIYELFSENSTKVEEEQKWLKLLYHQEQVKSKQ